MILYSIIPSEIVFKDCEKEDEKRLIQAEYMGEKIQVAKLSDNNYKITRIISTSLDAYLNPNLQPGIIIKHSSLNNLKV